MAKTKYELQQELKGLNEETGLKINIQKLRKAELEEEIRLRKIILTNKLIKTERSKPGRLEPRQVRFELKDGLNVPVEIVQRLSKPTEKRAPGRPPKVKPAPEEIQTPSLPPSIPSLAVSTRSETLGASNESDESKISFTMLKCTCLTCPAHSGYRRL